MAGTALISSTFNIKITPTNAVATVVTMNRTFRIVKINGNNETGAPINVTVATVAGNATRGGALAVGANTSMLLELDQTAVESTGNITVTSNTGCTVNVGCVAVGGGETLPAT